MLMKKLLTKLTADMDEIDISFLPAALWVGSLPSEVRFCPWIFAFFDRRT